MQVIEIFLENILYSEQDNLLLLQMEESCKILKKMYLVNSSWVCGPTSAN